jgi:hypothetical protein
MRRPTRDCAAIEFHPSPRLLDTPFPMQYSYSRCSSSVCATAATLLAFVVPYKISHEFDQIQKVAIGLLVMSNIMPLDEGPRSLPVLYFAINPMRPDRPDPVYFLPCRAQLGKCNVSLAPDTVCCIKASFLPIPSGRSS